MQFPRDVRDDAVGVTSVVPVVTSGVTSGRDVSGGCHPLETTLGVGKKNNRQGTQIQWGTGGCGKKTKDIFEEIYTSCLDIHVKKLKKKRNIGTKIGN